jgi:superfamily II DNA or RNA helicase
LAHRDELLSQARDEIAAVAPTLTVSIEKAAQHAADSIPQPTFFDKRSQRTVVVASVQTLHEKRRLEWGPYTFSVIIIDEAHHSSARSYVNILKHFGAFDDLDATRVVGFTATPNRTDGVGLGAVFQEIAVEHTLPEMISRGVLAPIKAWQVNTGVDLSDVRLVRGDYNESQLQETVNVEKRNLEIVAAYEKYASGTQAIAFCAGVEHSHEIARLFNDRGILAKSVWGSMDRDERAAAIASYHSGETRILANFAILIEGFNAPQTECIILARPTTSDLLVTQMLGRGTRLHPGKEHMIALDIADVTSGKSLASVASLFGLPAKFQTAGGDVVRMANDLESLDPRLQPQATDRDSLERIVAQTKRGLSVVEIDIFAALQENDSLRAFSPYSWTDLGNERFLLRPEPGFTYEVHADALDRYALTWREEKKTVVAGSKSAAFRLADATLRKKHADKVPLFDTRQKWRQNPATEKQIALLGKLVPGRELPKNLTGGAASALLQALFARRVNGKRTDTDAA